MRREIRAPREVLPQESIRVFVGATLPRTPGITEIHMGVRCQSKGLVVREFHPSIPSQRVTELFRQLPDLHTEGRHHGLGVLARNFHEHRKPGVPLDERRDVGIATSGHKVAFPMTRDGSGLNLRGAIGNRDPIDNLATPQSPDIAVPRLSEYSLSP